MRGANDFRVRGILALAAAILALAGSGSATAAINFEAQWRFGEGDQALVWDTAAANDGSLYVLRGPRATVLRIGSSGETLDTWKSADRGANSLAVDPNGNVLIAAENGVERFGPDGRRLRFWRVRGKVEEPVLPSGSGPAEIAVGPSGEVYLLEGLEGRVIRLSPSGKVLGTFGGLFNDSVDLMLAEDIAVGSNGRLYVSDVVGDHVRMLGPRGQKLGRWGGRGNGPGKFRSTGALATDGSGHVYVGDSLLDRVQEMTEDGDYVDQRGGTGFGPSRFWSIGSIAAGGGILYVTDRGGRRIQKFTVDSAPHNPQALVYFDLEPWLSAHLPGTRIGLTLKVQNFGDLAAEGLSACPDRSRRFTREVFGRVGCERIERIEPGAVSRFRVKGRIPAGQKKGSFESVQFKLRTENAGRGEAFGIVSISKNLDFLEDFSLRNRRQSVAMRLRASGAPGN